MKKYSGMKSIEVYQLIAVHLTTCTVNSKMNRTTKYIYLSISKLHSVLAVANLLAHNNITISYYVQVIRPLRLHTQLVTPIHWLVTQRMNMR